MLFYFKISFLFLVFSLFLFSVDKVQAFCGFYVAKADTGLFNKASQVVLVRDGKRTVISMMNDFEGPLKNFAMVVPVPQVLKKGQVHVGNKKLFARLDSFTAPRLVEYFDPNPCARPMVRAEGRFMVKSQTNFSGVRKKKKSLGVKVIEQYTVGEYDIMILSAEESHGLETWLRESGYSIPKGAHQALAPYIKQKMKFFVAKVNLKEQSRTGLSYLRPLQFAFESEKFMLPIRLGMLNAKGPQELFVYVLTKKGRVETTNYQTVKLPTDMDIPIYVKNEFPQFYRAMFDYQVKKEQMKVVFLEYFWDMGWCDPCATDPLSMDELRGLGVFWVGGDNSLSPQGPGGWKQTQGAQPVKVTRLHLRYTKKTFPDDLMFHQTKDKRNFQGRYILRHPWKGQVKDCRNPHMAKAAERYYASLPARKDKEAQNLAYLTGWGIHDIRKKMNLKNPGSRSTSKDKESKEPAWWEKLWKKDEK